MYDANWSTIDLFTKNVDAADAVESEDGKLYDGIEFSLRALPLGGYVCFPENYNRTLAFEQDDMARRAQNEAPLMRLEGASALEQGLEKIAAQSFVLNVATLVLLKK